METEYETIKVCYRDDDGAIGVFEGEYLKADEVTPESLVPSGAEVISDSHFETLTEAMEAGFSESLMELARQYEASE